VDDTERSDGSVTRLLRAWSRGDLRARDDLMALMYDELRRRAASYLRQERTGHTLTLRRRRWCTRLICD
jgi:hypothetical protein